jgi:endo-1,4-beta-xylanase
MLTAWAAAVADVPAEVLEQLPASARVLLDASDPARLATSAEKGIATFSTRKVQAPSFDKALGVDVRRRGGHPWDVQAMSAGLKPALAKGHHVLLTFSVRAVGSTDQAVLLARVQGNQSPWPGVVESQVTAGRKWRRIWLHARTQRDFAAGSYGLTMHLGARPQSLEIGGLAVFNLGKKVDVSKLPFTPITYDGQEPDAVWRKAAAERIERHRKADLRITVVDARGRPLEGAKVHVEMLRHAYGFGTFLECGLISGQGPDARKLRARTLAMFNRCTTPIYWADWGWANPRARKRYMQCAAWAADNALATRGHVIIYPGWQFLPASVRKLADDPPALRKRLLAHVKEVVGATRRFGFSEYDVTNELRHLTEIHSRLGREAVAEWFRVARRHAPPTSRMAINENTILTRGGLTENEQDNYAQWIRYLMDRRVGPDVIGMQGHFSDTAVTPPARVVAILDRFAKFGLPIHITEFDLPARDDQGQGRYVRDFLTACFSHPATEAVTVWGFWAGKMWRPGGALIAEDWTLRPSGRMWLELTRGLWWTDEKLVADRKGQCGVRGFLGRYRISVRHEGLAASTEILLDASGASQRLVCKPSR